MRGDDDLAGEDHAAVLRLHPAGVAVVDGGDPRALAHVRAVAGDPVGHGEEELARVELELVVEAHRARHLPREVDRVDELRGQAGLPRGVDLLAQLPEVAGSSA